MANNGDIKEEIGSVISGTHLATIEKGFGDGVAVLIVAFLSTVGGLINYKIIWTFNSTDCWFTSII